jgi:predicted DNA-binding transcriptional regulator AlpA
MQFISIKDVLDKLNISKSYLNKIRKNDVSFPRAVKLSERRNTVFNKDDIEYWMSSKFTQLDLFTHHHGVMV